jgi:hypothetical protein
MLSYVDVCKQWETRDSFFSKVPNKTQIRQVSFIFVTVIAYNTFCLNLKAHSNLFLLCLAASGVEHAQHNLGQEQFKFGFLRAAFHSQLKSKIGDILTKVTALCTIHTSMVSLSLHVHTLTPPQLTNLVPPLCFPHLR